MNGIDFKNGTVRALIVFGLSFLLLWTAFYIFSSATGLSFYGETVLILIGAGWIAYWTWKKTEVGRY